MNPTQSELILKSWSKINEIALIKDVATKGEFIELCQEYIATKKGITLEASCEYFHKIVDEYVQRLLNEKLTHKAENILRNIKRDIKSIFYQFVFECHHNKMIRDSIIEHLQKIFNKNTINDNEVENFQNEFDNYKFYWLILKDIQACENLCKIVKHDIKSINLENFMKTNEKYKNIIIIKLYFYTNNDKLLNSNRLNKKLIWEFFIDEKIYSELIIWCNINKRNCKNKIPITTELLKKYTEWNIDNDMFMYAKENLKIIIPEILKDLLIYHGHILPDEKNNIKQILNRIFRQECFNKYENLLGEFEIAKYLIDNKLYTILLEDFINVNDLKVLSTADDYDKMLLNLITLIKSNNLMNTKEFLKLSQLSREYLHINGDNQLQEYNSLIYFGELLLNNYNFTDIHKSLISSDCKIQYISLLHERLQNPNAITAHQLFKINTNIDLIDLTKDFGDELPSFSNQLLNQKYSKEFKLNFIHYLKQQRCSSAIYYFFIEQLLDYTQISRSQIFNAIEIVNDLAIRNYKNSNLFSHCIGFMEMLNFDTQNLRSLVKLLRNYGKDMKILDFSQLIYLAEEQLFQNNNDYINNYEKNKSFPLQEYESIWKISKLHTNVIINTPIKYLLILANQNDWWKLLLFIQYFDISLNDIKKIYKKFNISIMGENFMRALLYDTSSIGNTAAASSASLSEKSKRRTSFSRQKTKTKTENNSTTSGDTMASSVSSSNVPAESHHGFFKSNQQIKFILESNELDLFAIIISSTNNIPGERIPNFSKFLEIVSDFNNSHSTSYNLMKNCIKWKLPILAVLSTIVCDLNCDWNWLIWLSISTDNFKLIETCGKNFNEISNRLIENCVKNGNIHILHRSFNIFFKDNKFTYFTKFLQESINLNFTDDCITYLRLYFVAWSNNEICLPLLLSLSPTTEFNDPDENIQIKKDNLMIFTINLIIQHLKYNFSSAHHKQKLLNLISNSGINDLNPHIDFTLLRNIFEIISATSSNDDIILDLELLINPKYNSEQIYNNLLVDLNDSKQYDKAIQLAELLNISTCDIIYTKWINELNLSTTEKFDFSIYEYETEKYSLPPEFLVNFYIYTSQQYTSENSLLYNKYLMYKAALDVIKHNHLFPNETFDRDLIEYEMILCLIQSDQNIDYNLEIYHSEYFEEILRNERFVLYKSFLELKELAGIDDLTTKLKIELTETMNKKLGELLNLLLDKGDIVEALRLQAMFECPTVDLRYLVFCMALAEGLTTIYNLSDEERMIFVNVEKSLFVKKFEKRTLDTTTRPNPNVNNTSGERNGCGGDMSDSNSTIEFEEIPSKEKQEILDALQGFASNLKYGVNLGKRIVMTYRTAMYLDKDYIDVLRTKDAIELLKNAIEWDCLKKLLVVNDIFTSTQMTSAEISAFLADEIATAIIRPVFYILNADHQNINYHQTKESILWGYDLDREFHLILELCPNTTILGQNLFEYCDVLKVYRKYQDNQEYEESKTFENLNEIIKKYGLPSKNPSNSTKQVLSHKKQNTIYVELLIKAHECFMHECSMEGIADVLNRAKNLNNILAKANSWKLITRMLTGIGRYREMYYCFDTLIQNEQFEFLLGQFDEERTKGLRYAIISYIRDSCPQNKEYLKLVALHFLMYKELAEMWEDDANLNILKILSSNQIMDNTNNTSSNSKKSTAADTSKKQPLITKLKCTSDVLVNLKQILESLTQSTENYLLDNKLRLAQQTASKAELIAMQIDLVNKGLTNGICNVNCCGINYCICVLNIQSRDEFRELINSELRVPQTLILSRAYSYDINWSEVLLWQFIILDNQDYLNEFIKLFDLSDTIIENIVKGFQLHTQIFACTAKMEENLESLVEMIQSVSLRYKLASVLSLKKTINTMLNDESLYYLKDSNYGRNDFNIPNS